MGMRDPFEGFGSFVDAAGLSDANVAVLKTLDGDPLRYIGRCVSGVRKGEMLAFQSMDAIEHFKTQCEEKDELCQWFIYKPIMSFGVEVHTEFVTHEFGDSVPRQDGNETSNQTK